jgi:hypothetical protein
MLQDNVMMFKCPVSYLIHHSQQYNFIHTAAVSVVVKNLQHPYKPHVEGQNTQIWGVCFFGFTG